MNIFDKYNVIRNFHDGSVIEYNTRFKIFTTGMVKILRYSFSCCKGKAVNNKHNGSYTSDQLERKTNMYLKKVRTNIIDLALNNNNWEYFVTLTFDDKEFTNSIYSHDEAISLLKKWINNQHNQNKSMKYLIVAELTSTGRLHFHGLFSNVPKWEFKESRYPLDYKIKSLRGELIIIEGKQIYNLLNYDLGFTTISMVENVEKVSNYISKYATKDLIKIKNKKRYWYSRNLIRPKEEFYTIDSNLADYLSSGSVDDYDIDYYKEFKKESCSIEVAELLENKLPIIDRK